ncbi:hypothetical protein ASE78_16785 [Sphingomonas sp. Leaf25]|nr:hypothetical protein ASE78_16785 [Sphingomonas sp. Leaf25]
MSLLNRRETIGSIVATSLALPAFAQTRLVIPFDLRIFIPAAAVSYAGRSFGGGTKVRVDGTLDCGVAGPAALRIGTAGFDETKEYDSDALVPVDGGPAWARRIRPGAAPIAVGHQDVTDATLRTAWALPPGATHGCEIVVNGRNPLVRGAPAIDATFTLGLRRGTLGIERWLRCAHDGFPSYEFRVGGRVLRAYDCIAADATPLALFPPAEIAFTADWSLL